MLTAVASVTIKKGVGDVFKFVGMDYFINHPRWDPRVVESKPEKPGAPFVGLKGTEVRRQGGRNTSYAFEVTEFQPNKVLAMKASGGPAKFWAAWTFEPISEKEARLDIEFKLAFVGLMRLMEPMMGGSFRKEVRAAAMKIKELMEK